MITRKDFMCIARAMRDTKPIDIKGMPEYDNNAFTRQWKNDVEALVRVFTSINPRFNAELFRRECGFEWECQSCRTAQ